MSPTQKSTVTIIVANVEEPIGLGFRDRVSILKLGVRVKVRVPILTFSSFVGPAFDSEPETTARFHTLCI